MICGGCPPVCRQLANLKNLHFWVIFYKKHIYTFDPNSPANLFLSLTFKDFSNEKFKNSALRSPLSASIMALFSGGLMAVFLLWLVACAKDKTASTAQTQTDLAAGDRTDGDCQCQYQILSVVFTIPPSPAVGYDPGRYFAQLNTQELCTGGCPFFKAFYSPSGCVGGGCADDLSGAIPTGWQDFKCTVPEYSDFVVASSAMLVKPGCLVPITHPLTIQYKVRCLEDRGNGTGCPDESGISSPPVWVESPTITVSSMGATPDLTGIVLEGCGCAPNLQQ